MTKNEEQEIRELEARLEKLKSERTDRERVEKLRGEVEKLEKGIVKQKKDLILGSILLLFGLALLFDCVDYIVSYTVYNLGRNEFFAFVALFKIITTGVCIGFSWKMLSRYIRGVDVHSNKKSQ